MRASPELPVVAAALFREEVARARGMDPADKLLAGPRLFDRACRLMADGIRHRQPGIDDEALRQEVVRRLRRLRSIESR